VRLVLG